MSILQKQRKADAKLGYARDFPPLIARIAPRIRERHIRVIANAGGVNPIACAREVLRLAPGLKVAVVLGDDVSGKLDELYCRWARTAQYGHRSADYDDPRPHSERQCLPWRIPYRRGA